MTFKPWEHVKVEHNYTGSTWFDFTLDCVRVQTTLREFTGKHTATLSFYNPDMDPSQGDGTQVIRKGDKVRISAKNSSGTFRKMATFRVAKDGVSVAIDLTKPSGRQNLVTVNLEGVGITGVGGSAGGSGVATLSELSNTIEGAAFEINGEGDGSGITAPDGDFTEVSDNDAATEFDQIVLTRDSRPGTLVYEDPEGTIQIFNSATHQTGAATLEIAPANYSHIDMAIDMSHVVNVLKLKKVSKVKAGKKGSAVAVISTKFKDQDSIDKFGKCRKVLTIHGRQDFDDYAAEVFAKNADPDPVPTSVTIPIREAGELLGGYEDGVYVTKKCTVEIPDGTVYACRVKRITHTITPKLWTVQVFLRGQDVMQSPREEKSAALGGGAATEVANNPDGSIEREKLAFPLPLGKVETLTIASTGDQAKTLTYRPIAGTLHVRWNGLDLLTTDYDRDGWTVDIPDPDDLMLVGDVLEFQYLYDDLELAPDAPGGATIVGDVESNSASADVVTLNVPIDTPSAGDTIVLFAARGQAPAGWTTLVDYGTNHVSTKVSDGTETVVTIVGAPSNATMSGFTVCLAGSPDLVTATSSEPRRVDNTYEAPALAGGVAVVSYGRFDGPGSSIGNPETIVSTTPTALAIEDVDSGRYGIALAEGRATFSTSAGGSSSAFDAITVGVET